MTFWGFIDMRCAYLFSLICFSFIQTASAADQSTQNLTNAEYAKVTNKDYWKIANEHKSLMNDLKIYLDQYYQQGSDMHRLYETISELESLTHDKNFAENSGRLNYGERKIDIDINELSKKTAKELRRGSYTRLVEDYLVESEECFCYFLELFAFISFRFLPLGSFFAIITLDQQA